MNETETTINVRAALDGDQESLGWVFSRFSPFLLAEARYRLSRSGLDGYEPEDIVHDAWMICVPKLDQVEAHGGRYTPSLLQFLSATILRHHQNLLLKELRRRESRKEAAEPERFREDAELSYVANVAMRNDCAQKIRKAIDALSDAHREILILRGVEGLPYEILTNRLRTTEGTLRVRFHRALEKLRHALPPSMADELED